MKNEKEVKGHQKNLFTTTKSMFGEKVFNDMKKDDYQGNIGPDISGFIKSEIDER